MNFKYCLLILILTVKVSLCQEKSNTALQLECIAFYNLENLFDTIIDPDTNKILQEDFTPFGKKNFDTEKYNLKLNNLASVIDTLGKEVTPLGASIIGVCEVENRLVLEDLVAQQAIGNKNYKIVHHEGPDRRGIDCALLYDPLHFKLLSSRSFKLNMPDDSSFRSRDQLLVTGELLGEEIHFIVVHWPSRRGGEAKSRPKRIQAAKLARSILDSIHSQEKNAKVIIMGDFNDDPSSPSIKDYMKAKMNNELLRKGQLFNTMGMHYKMGIGTLAYRDQWNLFDQFIITHSLLDPEKKFKDFTFYKSVIYNKSFLKNQKGNFRGYPHRTFVGSTFLGGYSDHFPVYMLLVRKAL
jgi:hypothetical protein